MKNKLNEIYNIYINTLEKVTLNENEFIKFTKFYSRFYKYNFQEALLIYAQNENSTAVATYNQWQSIKFQVKKGSKGIALFSDDTYNSLKYVFDVSSTYQNKINLWKYNDKKHKHLITEKKYSIKEHFIKNKLDYIKNKDYIYIDNIELKELLFNTNLIAKCNRLGIDVINNEILSSIKYNLKFVDKLNRSKILSEIFTSIQEDLKEIEKIVKNYERNIEDERVKLYNGQRWDVISKLNDTGKVESWQIRENGNGIYETDKSSRLYNIGNDEQISINIQRDRQESLGYDRRNNEEENGKRVYTGRLEYSKDNRIQEDVTQRSRGNNDKGIDISRPFQGDRDRIEFISSSIVEEGQEKTVPFYIDTKEDRKEYSSFLNSNFSLYNKKTSYPLSTNQKIQANIDAIKLLFKLEKEKRIATNQEKEILSNYVGWGGLPEIFEKEENIKSSFIIEKSLELRDILTDKEYAMVRASTLNAHYTPNDIICEMYNTVSRFGYNQGIKILEPSCGIGNFIGNLPSKFKGSRITGVELDSITGRIAKQLYPNSKIKINGFEKEYFNEDSFDLVIGNIPFGDYRLYDKTYNKNNYLIHDYFINKSIELTKENGIVAVITSRGTLDKKDCSFRKEIAKKAELIGAIRLPNTAFKKMANTEVVSDILFFQKLEEERTEIPEWVNTTELKYKNSINNYFINNPKMILGKIDYQTNRYGKYDLTVILNGNLIDSLKEAVEGLPQNIINKNIEVIDDEFDELEEVRTNEINKLLDNNKYKVYRYIYSSDKIYYKYSDKKIEEVEVKDKDKDRLIEIIKIRDLSKGLIDLQMDRNLSEDEFKEKLNEFNNCYDKFVKKYGYINNKANVNAFKEDDDIYFITSLEKEVDGKFEKTKFFYQKTISPKIEITKTDNAKDALILCLNKLAKIDFQYIQTLYNKPVKEIIDELIEEDLIYLNPLKYNKEDISEGWEIKSIYLNGNVKNKLKIAENLKDESEYFSRNIQSLKEVIPSDVDFSDIKIDIGSDLYKPDDMKAFVKEMLKIHYEPDIRYNEKSSEWQIYNKTLHSYLAKEEYGTSRIGALYIFEKILNNQEIIIKDEIEVDDKKRYVQNKEETIKANEKRLLIEKEFDDFIFRSEAIRNRVMEEYNERFNNSINSNFDIELKLPNLASDIELRQHQKKAIARSIFSPNNLLLDHQVGAGKTFIMIVSAMENKRLGLANKPLLVVPNNITNQFKNDFFRLYPNANILYADEKSFETKNRKRFLSKISQNDYDAIIMGQSQFDLLKISKERRIQVLEDEIEDILQELNGLDGYDDRLTIKILERTRKSLETNLKKLMDSKEESILDFEHLGIDALYIDEAHLYKNLYFTTKLRNVAGINQTNSQKALNLKMKIDYLEEIGGKITFATGTPISNTMAEMYTMQRYLMKDILKEQRIYNFDSWQKIFATTETKLEISPAGNGFQLKTRFSNFRNIPELMNLYNSFADVVTTDMINLPIPECSKEVIEAEASEELVIQMKNFGKRAESFKSGVDPRKDNILKVVHEGRYAGLDIRHIDENNIDYENSKVNLVVNKVVEIYKETMDNKSTQVIFSDLSTPKSNEFNIYDDIKEKLIKNGINEEEIAFVHSAKNSKDREEMFAKVRSGEIRVILGSTTKMGAGTNFQDKLIALYHLDTPWRPSDLEQREGRILRQGNENKNVRIFKCITKGSFDAYSWQILEQKQRFITQSKIGAITGREVKDIDDVTLDYAEIKALATGNPKIKRKMEVDTEIEKLKVLESAYRKTQFQNEKFLKEIYPKELERLRKRVKDIEDDLKYINQIRCNFNDKDFEIILSGNKFNDKETSGELLYIMSKEKSNKYTTSKEKIGEYKGFVLYAEYNHTEKYILLSRTGSYQVKIRADYKKGNIDLLDRYILEEVENLLNVTKDKINDLEDKKELIYKSSEKEFEHKETLIKLYKEKVMLEREFDDENKTCVQFEYEEVEENIISDEIEL